MIEHHLYLVANAFVELVESAIKILTLGFVRPTWSFSFVCWWAKREMAAK